MQEIKIGGHTVQPLTKKQSELYSYCLAQFVLTQCIPTRKQSAARFGIAVNAVQDRYTSLIRKGWIERISATRFRFIGLEIGAQPASVEEVNAALQLSKEALRYE